MTVGADPNAYTSAWRRKLDDRGSRLYDLTQDEIKIVEEARCPLQAKDVTNFKTV